MKRIRIVPKIILLAGAFFTKCIVESKFHIPNSEPAEKFNIRWKPETFIGNDDKCIAGKTKKGTNCDIRTVRLQPVSEAKFEDENSFKIFFVESSNATSLIPRYACAVESAMQNSNVDDVVVVLTNDLLDLSLPINNATAHLYDTFITNRDQSSKKETPRLHFYSAAQGNDMESLIKATPLGKDMEKANKIMSTINNIDGKKRAPHMADMLRLCLVYLYGGFYADLDTIILKDLKPLFDSTQGVISTDQDFNIANGTKTKLNSKGEKLYGKDIANGFFGFRHPKSEFMRKSLNLFGRIYNAQDWNGGGSKVLTRVLRVTCNIRPRKEPDYGLNIALERYSAKNCNGEVEVVPPKYFYPSSWLDSANMWSSPRSMEDWLDYVKDSYSIDFFQTSVASRGRILKPQYYGKKMPAYAALAQVHCPAAFWAQKFF